MKELRILKPPHRNAIRLIVLGMPVKEAADLIGVSHTYMSTVYRSRQGREFELKLQAAANEYTARMLALGLMPKFFRDVEVKGPAKRPYSKNIHNCDWD